MKGKERRRFGRMLCCFALVCAFSMFPGLQTCAKDIVIMIDPGHGGPQESGASRTWKGVTYEESVLNLKIAKYLKQELETYTGVKVYMTRTSNSISFMDRETRVLKAKNKNAAALVSIHINSTEANKQTKVSGAYAVVPSTSKYKDSNKYAKKARALGTTILEHLHSEAGLRDNGYWFDDELGIILYGMKYKVPSIIVEHCYVNNPNDCTKYLGSNAKLKKLGVADAAGIADYFGLKKKNGSSGGTATANGGWKTVNGKRYYYTAAGKKLTGGWRKIGGKYYCFGSNGVLKTGVFKSGKNLYLTDKNGVRQTGFVKMSGNCYYANSNGKLYLGWQTYKGRKFYFNPANGKAYKGLKKIGKNKYFFSKSTAIMKTRWQKVSEGRLLYFSTTDGRMLKNRWLKSRGSYYYLGSDGRPYTSTRKTIDGVTYKFNAKGICTNYGQK